MRSQCTVLRGFLLFGVLQHHTVTSDKSATESVTSSPDTLTPAAKSWPRSGDNKSLALATQRDIFNAFSIVTNDSNRIKQMASEMYNLNSANPAYVFQLPIDGGAEDRFLIMHKSDFVQPIFPNVSSSYVRLMQSKVKMVSGGVGESLELTATDGKPTSGEEDHQMLALNLQTERNFIEYVNKVNKEVSNAAEKKTDEWELLGLHGWKGALSKPKKNGRPYENEDTGQTTGKTKDKSTEKWDLPGKMQEASLELNIVQTMRNTSILKMLGNLSQATPYPIANTHQAHLDREVYIGRVNDPFGHSTKWNIKNSSSNLQEDRTKRAVIELYSMIKCSTGCDPIIYKGYGCYCGFLGDGQPVDGIDVCCKLHDKCYTNSNCISYLEYFVPYIWKCYRGKPLCALDHGEWGEPSSCAGRLCKCDMILSQCLRRFVCPQRRAICRTSTSRILQNLLFNF